MIRRQSEGNSLFLGEKPQSLYCEHSVPRRTADPEAPCHNLCVEDLHQSVNELEKTKEQSSVVSD